MNKTLWLNRLYAPFYRFACHYPLITYPIWTPRFYTLTYGDVIYWWPLIIKNHSQNCWRVTRRRRAWRKMLPWRCATSSHLHVIWMDENSRGSLTTVNTNASPRLAAPIEAWIFRAKLRTMFGAAAAMPSIYIIAFLSLIYISRIDLTVFFKSSKIKRLYITDVDQFRFPQMDLMNFQNWHRHFNIEYLS